MDHLQSEERQKIVREELKQLSEDQYIEESVYVQVSAAHRQFYADLQRQQQETEDNRQADKEPLVKQTPKQKKVKRALSSQEVRERNITWSLNLGVILLLIGGLVLATSTWEMLSNWVKTGLIGLVSVLFFGLAYVTMRVLKIEKTAFAFYVLGSLFLPIVILSAGYFGLFGSYFSFSGEGRFLYGAAGSILILPVYLFLSFKLASRLFVWFSYVMLSVFAGFLIASLYLPADGFYLGIMVFNAALILAWQILKKQDRYQLFTKEFVHYLQGNLILSTLLMLVFYNHELFYSMNLMLTAALYFAMIFVTNHRAYHFVFSAMLVYGAYQLIEFSVLHEIDAIAYALLGFVFLALPAFLEQNDALEKAFRYTSAVVSFFAFLYISLEGILLRMNEPSVVLLIAYVIISLNFTFLANRVRQRLFSYLSPVFFMAALYEVVIWGREIFDYVSLGFPMFIAGFFLYLLFGCFVKVQFLQSIKEASRDVGGFVMLICLSTGFGVMDQWQVGTMFLLLAVTAILMDKFEKRESFKDLSLASWMHAIAAGLAMSIYARAMFRSIYPDRLDAEGFVFAGITVLLISFLWRKRKQKIFSNHTFYAANGFYLLGMLMTFTFEFPDPMRALVVLGGVGMAYLLYRKTKWKAMPYIVSGISLLFYFTVLYAVHMEFTIQSELFMSLQFIFGSVLLLGIGSLVGKKDSKLMKSFWWAGHIYLPISFLPTLFTDMAFLAFLVATAIYALSIQKARREWMIKTLLYASFTSFWAVIVLGMGELALGKHSHYAFLLTSMVLVIGWYGSKNAWTRRIAYYVVPFSLIGIITFTSVIPYDLVLFIVTVLYAMMLLHIMHREKWDSFNVVPLLLVFYALGLYGFDGVEWEYIMLLAVAGFAAVLTLVGMIIYPFIYQKAKEKTALSSIDWYTIVGFIALCSLYLLTGDALWSKLVPGLLLSCNLIIQRKRFPYIEAKWFVFSAVAFLLQPYYTVLINLDVAALIEREMYVLPWIALVIFLKRIADPSYKKVVKPIQWGVLIIVSLLLVQDGMESNTIYDALIVGTLSLTSMLGGMMYQLKSFFFVGAGVLLLNVFLQTRPYWGNLPWWAYLLIAGSILISVASYNEWHKQKTSAGKDTLISMFKEKVVQRIKKWE
ncbi:hypothetical protein [Virgibacillus ainsalahensis]